MSRPITPYKRNLSSTSSTSSSPKAGDKKSKIFVSTNKYAALADDFDSSTEVFSPPPVPTSPSIQDAVTADSKSPGIQPLDNEHLKSPPIFVKNIANLNVLKNDLIRITGPDGFTLSAFNDVLKIKTPNCKSHLLIMEYLMDENKDYTFHTFRPRHLRPIKAVIRNIHHSTAPEEIETALSVLGFSVVSVSNLINRTKNLPLSLFSIELENNEFNRNIFNVSHLLNFKIIVEKPRLRKARGHPQCKRCQTYGHTAKYCFYPPRCVKCGLDHFTEDCLKSRDLPAKCALCTGDHTANFRGCPSYKKFTLSKNKKLTFRSNCNKNVQIPPKISSNEVPGDHARQLPRKSYAAATKTVTSSMDSISNVLSEFISNFNSLIAPLINLLTKIVNKRFCP